MGAWKDYLIDLDNAAYQQQQDDWNRYEMERDDALARRRELVERAWGLHRSGMKMRNIYPDLGMFNINLAASFREEARQIKADYK
jgi:hypothetical protein